MKYNRFLPLLLPIIVLVLSEVFFFWPRMIYAVLFLIIVLFWLTIRQLIEAAGSSGEGWNFLILPFCFAVGITALATMVPSKPLVQLFFFLEAVFLHFYFRAIYHYSVSGRKIWNRSLENLSAYGFFLSVYFIAAAAYGLQVFLGVSEWLLMIIMVFIFALIFYQQGWVNKINKNINLFYVFLGSFIMAQAAWPIFFLPLSFYVRGFILSLCYYMLVGVAGFYLRGQLGKTVVKRYLALGFVGILVVLLTAVWR